MEKQAYFQFETSPHEFKLFEYFPELKFRFDRHYLRNFRSILCKKCALEIYKNSNNKKDKSNHSQMFFEAGVLKNFTKLPGKQQLCRSHS